MAAKREKETNRFAIQIASTIRQNVTKSATFLRGHRNMDGTIVTRIIWSDSWPPPLLSNTVVKYRGLECVSVHIR
jgi:hypothetical protein